MAVVMEKEKERESLLRPRKSSPEAAVEAVDLEMEEPELGAKMEEIDNKLKKKKRRGNGQGTPSALHMSKT